jgi:PKD repeat protein
VVPVNVAESEAARRRIIQASLDIQAWYQVATGGVTWTFAHAETVRVYHAPQTREYYRDNGDWWGSLLSEMDASGAPIWEPGIVCALWAHGAGWWAGAAQGCEGECGTALLGVEAFPELNNPDYSGEACPGGAGVAAWPCTPEGAYAHELGHTLGLPHPADVPATQSVAPHSIMQTHWNYPDYAPPSESPWGFLTVERQSILPNPFLHPDVSLTALYPDADVVNLPDNGPAPEARFSVERHGLEIITTNLSSGASLYYWTFGDGSQDNDTSPAHTYASAGSFTLTLRATASNGMMDSARVGIEVSPEGPLDCSAVTAVPARLWPPNRRLVPISLSGAVSPDGAPVSIAVTAVSQDEPVSGLGRRDRCPDAAIRDGRAELRAERSESGDGRVYTVSYTATETGGAECVGHVRVCVPPKHGRGCIDGGALINSLEPCGTVRMVQMAGDEGAENNLRAHEVPSGSVSIEYVLRAESSVRLRVYDVAGRHVATLVASRQNAGPHRLNWKSQGLARGVYFLRLEAGPDVVTKSLLKLR